MKVNEPTVDRNHQVTETLAAQAIREAARNLTRNMQYTDICRLADAQERVNNAKLAVITEQQNTAHLMKSIFFGI